MARAILRTDVLAIAPELTTLSDQGWVDILAFANAMSSVGFDNDPTSYRLAKIFLCAHYATISQRAISGAAGPVVREAAGGLQRSYGQATTNSGTSDLGQTMYGQQYLSILRTSAPHGPFLV